LGRKPKPKAQLIQVNEFVDQKKLQFFRL